MESNYDVLSRRDGETALEHHRRLVYGKLVDKTLADYDYSELASYVYGKDYSADVARRMLYGSCKTLELADQEYVGSIEDRDIISEIDAKMIELKKERQKFYDQRREYNKLISHDGRMENILEILSVSAAKLSESVGPLFDMHDVFAEDGNNEAILVLSDWHYGMKTNNVFNEYNTDICKRRVEQIVDAAIVRMERHLCRSLHVIVLGDLLHGAIHTGVRVASDELACDQLMQASEILAQAIYKLSKHTAFTYVYTTYGNHARTIQNKADSIHRDNMERIVGWWLTERFRDNDSITIMPESDSEFLFINSFGHEICATHGDLDTVKSSPRLLYTLFQKKYGKDIEYILLGDKHHRESFEELGVTSMLCGSLCGADEYSVNKRLFSLPSQLLLIVNEENGVDAEYRLRCQ